MRGCVIFMLRRAGRSLGCRSCPRRCQSERNCQNLIQDATLVLFLKVHPTLPHVPLFPGFVLRPVNTYTRTHTHTHAYTHARTHTHTHTRKKVARTQGHFCVREREKKKGQPIIIICKVIHFTIQRTKPIHHRQCLAITIFMPYLRHTETYLATMPGGRRREAGLEWGG